MSKLKLLSIVAIASIAASPVASIPLKSGDYGAIGSACGDEPNSTIMSFDGRNFAYPHASQCADTVTGRSDGVLSISETCQAAGDGSPTKASTTKFKLRPRGNDRFDLVNSSNTMTFRRCGNATFFDRH